MKKRKETGKCRMAVVLLAIMTAMLLSGCGSGDGERVSVSDFKAEKYVTLDDYQNLSVTVAAAEEIAEEQVEEQAFAVYLQNVTATGNGGVTDRAVAEGDTVIMDYVGTKDGVAFEGGTAENAELEIGSGRFIDGFEEGLIGVMPGETVDLNLTFPAEYHAAELAGAKVVFTVTVHYILPNEMTDAVVASFEMEEYQNVAELKEYAREQLEAAAQSTYQQNVEAAIILELIDNAVFKELPEKLVAQYAEDIEANVQTYAAMYSMDPDVFCNYVYGMDLAAYKKEGSEVTSQQMLVLQLIAEKEGLTLKEKELDARIETLALENGWASAEEFLAEFDKAEIGESILIQDVLNYLSENVTVTNE